jgi:hypothetical protein
MFDDPKFRAATWRADATTIWYGFWSLVLSGITAIISFVEGHGVAVSLLIAALVLPATFASLVLVRFRPQIQAQIASYFGSSNRAPVADPPVNPRDDAGAAISAPVAASSEQSASG